MRRSSTISALTILSLLLLWAALTETRVIGADTVPSPRDLWGALKELVTDGQDGTTLVGHFLASLRRVLIGLSIALLLGIPLGVITGYSRVMRAILTPIFGFFRPIPAIAFIPLIVLYFGIGEQSKIIVIAFSTTLYIALNVESGVRSVPESYLRLATNLEASRFQTLRRIVIPSALPQIFVGIRTGVAISWALVVAAELVAAQSGLGYLVMRAATFFQIDYVYIGVAMIALAAVLMEWMVRAAEARLIHWVGK
jgi:ABC-type nitrate/sulfonate/bicarbonate transport system permease component